MAAKAKSDIEIARAAKKRPILEIGAKLGIPAESLDPYGNDKAKVSAEFIIARRPARRQADPRHRHQPDAGGRREDDDDRRPRRRAEPHRQARRDLPARALARALLRHEGRRGRRRLCPGRADGGHQPPFHRRFPRHHLGAQSSVRDDRQPYLLGQRARYRYPPHRLAARHGHERPRASRDRLLARRRRQRFSARRRVRHHRRLGDHGDPLPRQGSRRSAEAHRRHRHRLSPRQERGDGARPEGRRRDDRAPDEGDAAEPRADDGEQSRLHPRRAVRQHRAWLQFGDGDEDGAETRRLCGDRSRLRRRPRRGEILRHQMPRGRAEPLGRRHRRDRARAQDAWRRRQATRCRRRTSRR